MDYDFSRLCTRSFEQLVQSLAACVLGPGTVIFGDGPDGGREAIFRGRVPLPNSLDPWDGYIVVQAKFRQRALGGGKDADWVLDELQREFAKYTRKVPNPLPTPDYFILATNVVLTPARDAGGKDRVNTFLQEQAASMGLKSFVLWDYDQLRTFLDIHEEVRTSYAAWVTPGDVLAAVLKEVKPKHHDFKGVMSNFIQKEIQSEQFVNLGQAGHMTQDRIPLAKVFIDLPLVSNDATVIAPETTNNEVSSIWTENAIEYLLSLSAERHNRTSSALTPESPIPPGRIVLIGGPGQGKTTVTQFLCQLHRMKLLQTLGVDSPLPEVAEACEVIRQQSRHEKLVLPSIPRFPVRVELNRLASALASGQAKSLFHFILIRVCERTGRDLTSEDLRSWLACYPWLLALDGLDEVPASSNRKQTLETVQDFLVDVNEANGDLLLVATTRRQGYGDDFSPKRFLHLCLSPLTTERALYCAKRLSRERWGADMERVERVVGRLREASADDATARLLQSPLQVTIMTLLVETIGRPPKERWRLFNDYYQVIFRREKERDIPAARLLNTFQADIDVIHQRVGFELQKHSEQTGGTHAVLSLSRFREIVRSRLSEEGHIGEDGAELENQIVESALERLVFLVAPQENKVGFEVRSLQEFMAAEWLMNGRDDDVQIRLRAIAPAVHWRNVFLFAAGRCFHDKQHLRDTLYAICGELNEGKIDSVQAGVERAVLAGSRIALDILEDGAALSQPGQLRVFARLAMRLLDTAPCAEQKRLAKNYRSELQEVYQPELRRRLTASRLMDASGAWRALTQLIAQNVSWAKEDAELFWPTDPHNAFALLGTLEGIDIGEWLIEQWTKSIRRGSPQYVLRACSRKVVRVPRPILERLPLTICVLINVAGGTANLTPVHVRSESKDATLSFRSASEQVGLFAGELSDVHQGWRWLRSVLSFGAEPSAERLALTAKQLSRASFEGLWRLADALQAAFPWPLQMCLKPIRTIDDVPRVAKAAQEGVFGDRDSWSTTEARWLKDGIAIDELKGMMGVDSDLAAGSDMTQQPAASFPISLFSGISPTALEAIFRSGLASNLPESSNRWLIRALRVAGIAGLELSALSLPVMRSLLPASRTEAVSIAVLGAWPASCWEDPEASSFVDTLGHWELEIEEFFHENCGRQVESLIARDPQRAGVLRILAACCIGGYKPTSFAAYKVLFEGLQSVTPWARVIQIAAGAWGESDADSIVRDLALGGADIRERVDLLVLMATQSPANENALNALLVSLNQVFPEGGATQLALEQAQKRYLSDIPVAH